MSTKELCKILEAIELNYTNYDVRFNLVLEALLEARKLNFECGFRVDTNEPNWPVIVIYLPDIGEISWHMPPSNIKFDGLLYKNSERTKKFLEIQSVYTHFESQDK